MADNRYPDGPLAPARHAFAVTPDDDDMLIASTKKLYIGGTGDVTLRARDSAVDVVLVAVPAGTQIDVDAVYVRADGTTATNIVAFS